MPFGLEMLPLGAALSTASGASSLVRATAQGFADVLSHWGDLSADAANGSDGNTERTDTSDRSLAPQSQQDLLASIQAAIATHLQGIGLPVEQPMSIEIRDDGSFRVHADTPDRSALEDAIEQDAPLNAKLQLLAAMARHAGGSDDSGSHFVHYPPAVHS